MQVPNPIPSKYKASSHPTYNKRQDSGTNQALDTSFRHRRVPRVADQNYPYFLPSENQSTFRGELKDQKITNTSKGIDKNINEIAGLASQLNLQPTSHTTEDNLGYSEDPVVDDERLSNESIGTMASYRAPGIAPLSMCPAWDEINARIKIHLTGDDALRGLCDDAHFVRTNLPNTCAMLLEESTQTSAALLCFREMSKESTPKELREAFAELLPHPLTYCTKQSPVIIAAIADFHSFCSRRHLKITKVTMDAISSYLQEFPKKVEEPRTGQKKTWSDSMQHHTRSVNDRTF